MPFILKDESSLVQVVAYALDSPLAATHAGHMCICSWLVRAS